MAKRNKIGGFLLVLLVLGIARLALPSVLLFLVNDRLGELESYYGEVEDIDVSLWRGAYQLDNLIIRKREAEHLEPFVLLERADLSIDWARLFDGHLVAQARLDQLQLNLVEADTELESQTGEEEDWRSRLNEFFPVRFDKIALTNSTVRFRAPGIEAKDALEVTQIEGEVLNLTNTRDIENHAFSPFHFDGEVFKAPINLSGRVDPIVEPPTFDINLTLKKVELTALNPWLEEYVGADAESGSFELYLELVAAEGEFKGYAKPFMQDVNMFTLEEAGEKGFFGSIWEGLVELAAELFENQPRGEVATRVPLSGTMDEPDAGVVTSIVNVVRNAFLAAFTRSLDHSIELDDDNGGDAEIEETA